MFTQTTLRKLQKKDIKEDRYIMADNKTKQLKKETIKKLKSYPILKQNIEEFKKDLEDIKKEKFETVPAIHIVSPNNNIDKYLNNDLEERRLIESIKIRKSMLRDIRATKEIERAMEAIKDEPYNKIIEMQYFNNMSVDNIASELNCDTKTIYRNRIKLIDILTIKFFGGDAI